MKKLVALLLALCLMSALCAAVAEDEAMTLEEIQALFALDVDTEGMTAEEMLAKGEQYETGEGVVQWYAMAKAYYEAAEAAGSAEATEALARLQAHKEEVMANSPDAQGEIFDFFRTGMTAGQSGNYEQAYAIDYDDTFFFEDPLYRGLGSLGDLLRDGNGVAQDIEAAMAVYRFNAEVLGKGNAYTSMGAMYDAPDGTYPGIEHSTDAAIDCYLRSFTAENLTEGDFKGPRYVADYLDTGYTQDDGTWVEPDYVRAEEYYLIAAAGNGRTFDGTACYHLGVYYEEGREGIEQDYAKAVEYYTMAISDKNVHATMLGIPQTYLALGRLYENGLGVEADLETALGYYQQAKDAAQENLELVNAAGNEAAQAVFDDASEALERLSA